MDCFVITELTSGNNADTEIINKYIIGMKKQLRKSKSKLYIIDKDSLDKPLAYFEKTKKRPIVILIGFTFLWLSEHIPALLSKGIHPIVLSSLDIFKKKDVSVYGYSDNISSVSWDNSDAVANICQYFSENNLKNIAYFGYNPNFATTSSQMNAFTICKTLLKLPQIHPFCDCYANLDYIDVCSNVLLSRISSYNAIICSSPKYAVKLIYDLKKHDLFSEELHIAAIGYSPLSEILSPSITTYDFDTELCGQKAIKLYSLLINDHSISSLTAKIPGTLHPRESTKFLPYSYNVPKFEIEYTINPDFELVDDPEMNDINNLENLLYKSDNIDLKFIKSVLSDEDLKDFSEKNFISDNTLKYRIQNMCKGVGVSTKAELFDILKKWFR